MATTLRTSIENAEYYAARKSEQDMASALEACTSDFELISPPFGRTLSGASENLVGMTRFFAFFPDYRVDAECTLHSETHVLMVGRVSLTPNFELIGLLEGKARTAQLDFSAAFEIRDTLLARETFLIDFADLCEQSGLPLGHGLGLFGRPFTG